MYNRSKGGERSAALMHCWRDPATVTSPARPWAMQSGVWAKDPERFGKRFNLVLCSKLKVLKDLPDKTAKAEKGKKNMLKKENLTLIEDALREYALNNYRDEFNKPDPEDYEDPADYEEDRQEYEENIQGRIEYILDIYQNIPEALEDLINEEDLAGSTDEVVNYCCCMLMEPWCYGPEDAINRTKERFGKSVDRYDVTEIEGAVEDAVFETFDHDYYEFLGSTEEIEGLSDEEIDDEARQDAEAWMEGGYYDGILDEVTRELGVELDSEAAREIKEDHEPALKESIRQRMKDCIHDWC